MLRGPERDNQRRIHKERIDNSRRLNKGIAEQRLLALCRANEPEGCTPPAGQEERIGSTRAGNRGIGPRVRLGALLYRSVDARNALQRDRTLTRDVDSIVDQKRQLLRELMRPKLEETSAI